MMVSPRDIPSVDQILKHPRTEQLLGHFGHAWTVSVIRGLQDDLRQKLPNLAEIPSDDAFIASLEAELEKQSQPSLRSVINATGVLLHTNLGRAPLSREALAAVESVSSGYSTLEYDLTKGTRSKRDVHASSLLTRLTGGESALVVNNNAAGVLLALSALAKGKNVAISRSQMVEIGGGFRIPDVMKQSGAKLIEVGTTNRTRVGDFEQAIADGASVLLVAHQSNFKIIGFTEEPSLEELANLAHRHNLPLIVDLGSGALLDTAKYGLTHETTVQETLSKGRIWSASPEINFWAVPSPGSWLGRASYSRKSADTHSIGRSARINSAWRRFQPRSINISGAKLSWKFRFTRCFHARLPT